MSEEFANQTAEPAVENPTPEASPNEPEVTATSDSKGTPSAEELQAQLEAEREARTKAEKAKKLAESAIEAEKRKNKQLERASMTEAEKLEEQRKEMEEKARQYDIDKNALSAERILANAGLLGEDVKELTDLFVTEDENNTTEIAESIVRLIQSKVTDAKKTEREEILKEMPVAPNGNGETEDAFIAGFNQG